MARNIASEKKAGNAYNECPDAGTLALVYPRPKCRMVRVPMGAEGADGGNSTPLPRGRSKGRREAVLRVLRTKI